jgi:hypothetical protein
MKEQNPNKTSLPATPVDWDKLRNHGRPDPAILRRHEAALARLDRKTSEQAGGRRGR